jgi:mevalonate pyrophosphate decarboxylase
LPLNDSISLSIDELYATTKISIGPNIEENEIIVNGKKLDEEHKERFNHVFEVYFLLN